MTDLVNIALLLATIAFGLIGWLAPGYTMDKLGLLCRPGTTLGMSEIRAANGGLFVGLAGAALLIGAPLGYAMVGFAYAGAALGRLTSFVIDKSGERIAYAFVATEILFAGWLILANTGAADTAV